MDDLRGGMNGFPDRASVEKLRYYGIRTVVLHTADAQGTARLSTATSSPSRPNPLAAAAKPVAGLGITRRQVGSIVIYEIGPGPEGAARNRLMQSTPSKRLALAAILLVGLAYATMIQSFSWNQTSHYDLIRSLNDDRTTIDRLPGKHRRQGLLQGPLLLGARARPGAVRAALLRRAESRRTPNPGRDESRGAARTTTRWST